MNHRERVRQRRRRSSIGFARCTAIRFSTHVYNDEADVDLAARAIGPLVRQAVAG